MTGTVGYWPWDGKATTAALPKTRMNFRRSISETLVEEWIPEDTAPPTRAQSNHSQCVQ